MICHPIRYQMFSLEFEDYEKNRMYPPTNRKELTMNKLTLEHSEAVSAAKGQMIRLLSRETEPRWKAHVEEQVTLLGEVYWWILHTIYHPGLSFEKNLHGTFELKDEEDPDDGPETTS